MSEGDVGMRGAAAAVIVVVTVAVVFSAGALATILKRERVAGFARMHLCEGWRREGVKVEKVRKGDGTKAILEMDE